MTTSNFSLMPRYLVYESLCMCFPWPQSSRTSFFFVPPTHLAANSSDAVFLLPLGWLIRWEYFSCHRLVKRHEDLCQISDNVAFVSHSVLWRPLQAHSLRMSFNDDGTAPTVSYGSETKQTLIQVKLLSLLVILEVSKPMKKLSAPVCMFTGLDSKT